MHRFLFAVALLAVAFPGAAQTFDLSLNIFNSSQYVGGRVNTATYQITNHGPSASTPFSVDAFLQAGGTVRGARSDSGACGFGPSAAHCEFGSVPAGQTRTFHLDFYIPAGTTQVSYSGHINSSDANPSNNAVSVGAPVTSQVTPADLDVTASSSPATVQPGEPSTLTFAIRNFGPGPSGAFTVRGTLAPTLELIGIDAPGMSCSSAPPQILCSVAELNPGLQLNLRLIVRGTAPGATFATVAVEDNENDPVVENDEASAFLEVAAPPPPPKQSDLVVTLTAASSSVALGSTATFTATIRNDGPETAEGVAFTAVLPSQLQLLSVSSNGGPCTRDVVLATCTLPALTVGASATVTITASARLAGSATTQAGATAPADPNPANNQAEVTISITGGRSRATRRF